MPVTDGEHDHDHEDSDADGDSFLMQIDNNDTVIEVSEVVEPESVDTDEAIQAGEKASAETERRILTRCVHCLRYGTAEVPITGKGLCKSCDR